MNDSKNQWGMNRRRFISGSAASAASVASFGILGSSKTACAEEAKGGVVIGQGEHQYEVIHDWAKLPEAHAFQLTHNVAVDRDNCLYVIHQGSKETPDLPTIFAFDPEGKFMKAFGSQFQGGGHGLEVRTEGDDQFLYVTGINQVKTIAKLTLDGEEVWSKGAPLESGIYPGPGKAKKDFVSPEPFKGRNRFAPTNMAFHPDGGFYVADGYGSFAIHRYDEQANYLSSFGHPGRQDGEFWAPHGIWIDTRGEEPLVVIADRANKRLQWLTLDGEHRKTMEGYILPANIDQFGDTLLVPDLASRLTLLDKENQVIYLGEDPAWRDLVMKDDMALRKGSADQWQPGKFLHPHDACFDSEGNIFVAEWVPKGRISKLRKVS